MFPTLVRIPYLDVAIGSYGLLLAAGVAAGLVLAVVLARRDGVEPERMSRFCVLMLLAAFAGAKLGWVATTEGATVADLIVGTTRAGGMFYGALVTAIVASVLIALAMRLDWWAVTDAAAPGVALGLAFGRVGCFAAGCCWGTACEHPWGVLFPFETASRNGMAPWTPVHPVQLYEAALAALICVALVAMHGRRRFRGQVLAALLVLYPVARFTIEFWRGDDRGELLGLSAATGLSPAQLISIALIATAAALTHRTKQFTTEGTE